MNNDLGNIRRTTEEGGKLIEEVNVRSIDLNVFSDIYDFQNLARLLKRLHTRLEKRPVGMDDDTKGMMEDLKYELRTLSAFLNKPGSALEKWAVDKNLELLMTHKSALAAKMAVNALIPLVDSLRGKNTARVLANTAVGGRRPRRTLRSRRVNRRFAKTYKK